MNLPPSILKLRFQGATRGFRVWLPLFAIWPFLLLAAVLLAPIVIVTAIAFWRSKWRRPMLFSGPLFFRIFFALRGLKLDVRNGKNQFYVAFH